MPTNYLSDLERLALAHVLMSYPAGEGFNTFHIDLNTAYKTFIRTVNNADADFSVIVKAEREHREAIAYARVKLVETLSDFPQILFEARGQ